MPQRDWDMTTPPSENSRQAKKPAVATSMLMLGRCCEVGELLQAAHRARAKPQAMGKPEHSAGSGVEVGAWFGERFSRPSAASGKAEGHCPACP